MGRKKGSRNKYKRVNEIYKVPNYIPTIDQLDEYIDKTLSINEKQIDKIKFKKNIKNADEKTNILKYQLKLKVLNDLETSKSFSPQESISKALKSDVFSPKEMKVFNSFISILKNTGKYKDFRRAIGNKNEKVTFSMFEDWQDTSFINYKQNYIRIDKSHIYMYKTKDGRYLKVTFDSSKKGKSLDISIEDIGDID